MNNFNQSGLAAIVLLLLFCGAGYGQSFTASVNSTKIPSGEQFEVDFIFAAQDINGITNFQAPAFKEFALLSGPNRSTNMQFINGQVSASTGFSYILQARNPGKYTIGVATIVYKGTTYKTQPITVEVVQGQPKSNNPGKDEEVAVNEKEIAENLFIRATADKSSCVVGEQVTVQYKLFVRLNISSPEISKIPSYQGAWAEELESADQNSRLVNEVLNGKMYRTLLLKKVAVFPTQTGDITLTPYELIVPVMIETKKKKGNNRNWYDDFFDDPFSRQVQTVQFKARSNTLKIKVSPLPATADPSFTGAVGKFTISSSVDKKVIKENDPVTLKVVISGSGNIQLLKLNDPELPAGFERFEPKESDEIVKGVPLGGKKTYEYMLIPRTTGKLEIPEIKFGYYDPQAKAIKQTSTPALQLEVTPGDNIASNNFRPGNNTASDQEKDIRYIKRQLNNDPSDTSVLTSPVFWGSWILLTAGFAGFVGVRRKQIALQGDVARLKNSRAHKLARKRLKAAADFLKRHDKENFYSSLSLGLQGYIEDKFLIPKSEFTMAVIIETLKSKGISETLTGDLQRISDHCDFIRFAPSQGTPTDMEKTLQEAGSLIVRFEEEVLKAV